MAAARREGRRLLRLEVGDLRVDLILHRGPLLRQLLVLRLQRSQVVERRLLGCALLGQLVLRGLQLIDHGSLLFLLR